MAAVRAWGVAYASVVVMVIFDIAITALEAWSVHPEEEDFVRVRGAHRNFVEMRAARQAGGWTWNVAACYREDRISVPDGHRSENER